MSLHPCTKRLAAMAAGALRVLSGEYTATGIPPVHL